MTKKMLKKYTTIPQHLYVERGADRQLRDIIDDMQRPGYVLVARQMGKTNLLFNAKRNLESDNRKFVYIDLSNNFSTERECYNYIIDSILDVLDEDVWETRPDIEDIRSKTKTDHISYTKSLSKILKSLDKDLIIILDEIDALRTSEYSDNIFAVIRSNYFTRSNFAEFERLTYILSGVIEPKDLIKDRNKSPFNIGEKIYLEDFLYSEFIQFIEKSKLNIDDKLINHIYSWTSGNPRLSFDICSEIEELILDGVSITVETIDNLIKKKYFTSYDIPPIDHIRELISENKSIQDSVLQIISNDKTQINISDVVKNTLYLYGVISLNQDNQVPEIKNKIIKESLNIRWLESLIEDPQVSIDKAEKLINESHDYNKAIELLNHVILIDNIEKTFLSVALFYLGFAEQRISEYGLSNKHLLQNPVPKNISPVLHYRERVYIGQNYLQLGEKDKAKGEFEYVRNNYKNNITWATASLDLAFSGVVDESQTIELLYEIIEMKDEFDFDAELEYEHDVETIFKKIKSYAYYLLSQFSEKKIRISPLEYLELALGLEVQEHVPAILIKKSELITDGNSFFEEACEYILENQLLFSSKKIMPMDIDYNSNLHCSLLTYCFSHARELYERLLKYSIQDLNLSYENICKNTISAMLNDEVKYSFLGTFINKDLGSSYFEFKRAYISLSLQVNKFDDKHSHALSYLNLLLDIDRSLSEEDIYVSSTMIKYSLENNEPIKALKYAETIEPLFFNITDNLKYASAVFYFWLLNCHVTIGNSQQTLTYGREVLKRLEAPHKGKSVIGEEGEKMVKKIVLEFLSRSRKSEEMTSKHPRNIFTKKKLNYDIAKLFNKN